MQVTSPSQAREITRLQRLGFAALFVSVLVSSLSMLAGLVCVLLFLTTDDKTFLVSAMALAGMWLGFGLLNMQVMRQENG